MKRVLHLSLLTNIEGDTEQEANAADFISNYEGKPLDEAFFIFLKENGISLLTGDIDLI
jgi:hypothetical protein